MNSVEPQELVYMAGGDDDPLLETPMTIAMKLQGWVPTLPSGVASEPVNTRALEEAQLEYERKTKAPFSLLRAGETADDCDVFSGTNLSVRMVGRESVTEVIRLVNDAVTDLNQVDEAKARSKRPAISIASKEWTLNPQQHVAFTLLASVVLREVLKRLGLRAQSGADTQATSALSPADRSEIERARDRIQTILAEQKSGSNPQLIMGLYGKGGTGKSRVLQAVVDFAKRWHVADSVVITATSGIAGVMINGSTYHRALGLQGRGGNSGGRMKGVKLDEFRRAWSSVALMVIDEVSMASGAALSQINNRLQELLHQNNLSFGGIDVCFTGDLFQLEPVGGVVYTIGSTSSLEHVNGHNLYRRMNVAVELYHSHRHASDAEFDEICDAFRINKPRAQHLAAINRRVIGPGNRPPPGM